MYQLLHTSLATYLTIGWLCLIHLFQISCKQLVDSKTLRLQFRNNKQVTIQLASCVGYSYTYIFELTLLTEWDILWTTTSIMLEVYGITDLRYACRYVRRQLARQLYGKMLTLLLNVKIMCWCIIYYLYPYVLTETQLMTIINVRASYMNVCCC